MRMCLIFFVLNIHIPLYLGSRRKSFFRTSKYFCFLVPVSIISICISFVNCQIFISGHYWISILCCWHWLVRCDKASLWHFSQSSATWMRRCILADGFFLFHHCLLQYLLVIILLSLIKLTSNHFHLSHSYMSNWLQRTRVHEFVQSKSALCLYELMHTNCSVFTYYMSCHIPIDIIIAYYISWS